MTFRLPPEHTVDPTALFLSSCPVKCNDPEVNVSPSLIAPKSYPSFQVYPRPDNTVYVCAGGSKDSLPVPLDPAKVMARQPFHFRLHQTFQLISIGGHKYSLQVEQHPDTIEKVLQVAKQVKLIPGSFPGEVQVTR